MSGELIKEYGAYCTAGRAIMLGWFGMLRQRALTFSSYCGRDKTIKYFPRTHARIMATWRKPIQQEDFEEASRALMFAFAGFLGQTYAENRKTNGYAHRCEQDERRALREFAYHLCYKDERMCDCLLQLLEWRTRQILIGERLLDRPEMATAIHAIARKLLEKRTVSSDELAVILKSVVSRRQKREFALGFRNMPGKIFSFDARE